MFGFSLSKLLFTAVVILLIWHGFKWFARYQAGELGAREKKSVNRGQPGNSPGGEAADTVKCDVCGAYVVSGQATNCGKGGCPFPG